MKSSARRLVDHTHTTPAELFDNAVVGNGLADERGGIPHTMLILSLVRHLVNRAKLLTWQH